MPKRHILLLFIILLVAHTTWALDYDLHSGVHFSSWKSDDRDKGTQFYIPIQLETAYKDVTIGLQNACVYAEADSSATGEHSFAHFIDTKVNLTYKQISRWDWNFLLGLDFNLPTGKTGMNYEGLELLQDPDLNDISRYGEGFNVNPTLSMVKEWNKFAAGMGLGYDFRGEYDYSSQATDYDPGDLMNLAAEMLYDLNASWGTRAFLEYVHFGKDRIDSQDIYQNGDYLLLGVNLRYKVPTWYVSSTLQHIIRNKGKVGNGRQLITEGHNSNGNEWIFNVDYHHNWKNDSGYYIGGEVLTVSKNDYDLSDPLFVGKRQKISFKTGLTHPFTTKLLTNLYLKGFILDIDHTLYQPAERTYKGLSIGMDVSYHF